MSTLDINFEDKLKKFIEENCPYNFNITVRKDAAGIHIDNPEEIDRLDIFNLLSDIRLIADDVDCTQHDLVECKLDEIIDITIEIAQLLGAE